jgi:hypothetical protein
MCMISGVLLVKPSHVAAHEESDSAAVVITPQDIVFECPECGHCMVVDEAAVHLTVPCVRCHIQVIVPERAAPAPPPRQLSEWNQRLRTAAQAGDVAVAKEALDHGAPVDGATPQGVTALMIAAEMGHVEIIKALLDHGASSQFTDDQGQTAATRAGRAGHYHIVRLLWKAAPKKSRWLPKRLLPFGQSHRPRQP